MSKILFVDDEISRNLPALDLLFGSLMSDAERAELKKLQHSPFGATGNDIREVLKNNPVLEVEDTYAGAIKRILEAGDGHEYDLFLLDRNLATGNGMYTEGEIAELMPGYDRNAFERYRTREGDFLLLLLHLQGVPCREKVYFYSAYQADDIRSALYLRHMIGFQSFSGNNFVDKSDSASKDRFRSMVIEHLDRAAVAARYRSAFSGLQKAGMDSDRDRLIDILKDDSIPSADARVLLEHFLEAVQYTPKNYTVRQPERNLDFDALWYKNDVRGPQRVPQFVFSHCTSIKKFCNNYLSHGFGDAPGLPGPTKYSWLAIKNMLAEIFTWLDNELK